MKLCKFVILMAVASWFIFSMGVMVWQLMSPSFKMEDPDNCTRRHYDRRGNLVFLETRKKGRLHGHYKAPYPGGSAEGEYDSGFQVGTWREWYVNGALRRLSRYSQLQEITNKNGFVMLKSSLLERQDFNIDGEVMGIVSNGVGASVTMSSNGFDIVSYSTVGFATNVLVFYGGEIPSNIYVRQISISVSRDDQMANVFTCLADESGKIRNVRENRSRAHWMSGRLVADIEDAPPPPFLLGLTRYPFPSLVNCKPVFDKCIASTNGVLVLLPM